MTRPKKKSRYLGLKVLILFLFLTAYLLYDSNIRIVTAEYTLTYKDLPVAFNGYRIAQLSDIHGALFGKGNDILIDKVKSGNPDIIAITGDLIDSKSEDDVVRTLMSGLTKIAPVYFVPGNHEYPSGRFGKLLDILKETGVTVLRNEYIKLTLGKESILLAGIDDPNGPADMKTPSDFIRDIRKAEKNPFIIVLYHRNDKLPLYSSLGIDAVLCGHAHGGIIRLPFTDGLIGPNKDWLPTYTSGVYKQGNTNMVVSRGIGNHTGIPRFLNNPQIPVIVLRTVLIFRSEKLKKSA